MGGTVVVVVVVVVAVDIYLIMSDLFHQEQPFKATATFGHGNHLKWS